MIHPTAVVESKLPGDVTVGPYAVIGPEVRMGSGVVVGAHAFVRGPCTLGNDVRIGPSAVVGTDPQDLKYEGERTELVIGDRTVIREFANINRGTVESGRTVVGSDCLVMAYVHIAHDCVIGDRVILANAVNMAGHVVIEDDVTIGGVVPVHQFVRIGKYAMVGGGFRVNRDVPPFVLVAGNPLAVISLNSVGLRRKGISGERLENLRRLYRYLFRSDGTVTDKARRILEDDSRPEDDGYLADFILNSSRGVVT